MIDFHVVLIFDITLCYTFYSAVLFAEDQPQHC